jgi:hypothetical protein
MPEILRQTTWRPRPNAALDIAESLPHEASVEQLRDRLSVWLAEIGAAVPSQMPTVYRSVAIVRQQPNAVSSLVSLLEALSGDAFVERSTILSVLGELRREDAVGFLRDFAWRELPAKAAGARREHLSPRARAEALQAKAMQGLAYLGTEAALTEARRAAREHESLVVRAAAVDAFMWNRGDTTDAREELRRELPPSMHRFLARRRRCSLAHSSNAGIESSAAKAQEEP